MTELDIKELCEKTGVTPRTIHFYVQQGLLPAASAPGPGARYGQGHVSRLRMVRLLQKQHLPLAEIAKRMKGLTDAQVDQLVSETRQVRSSRGSALDYIRTVLAEPNVSESTPLRAEALAFSQSKSSSAPAGSVRSTAALTPTTPGRSQWERYTFADGFELHVRRPLSRTEQRQLDKLMSAARAIFNGVEEGDQS